MMDLSTLLGVLSLAMLLLGVVTLFTVWNTRRTVTCPENGEVANIDTDPEQAMRSTFRGEPEQVIACSRWPERANCARDCVHAGHADDEAPHAA